MNDISKGVRKKKTLLKIIAKGHSEEEALIIYNQFSKVANHYYKEIARERRAVAKNFIVENLPIIILGICAYLIAWFLLSFILSQFGYAGEAIASIIEKIPILAIVAAEFKYEKWGPGFLSGVIVGVLISYVIIIITWAA